MMVHFKYLSTRSGKTFVLMMEHKRYIFNIFEGFQRYCIEGRLSLSGISAMFLCSKECIPPFVGTYLTLRDMNRRRLDVVCDKSLREIVDSANGFADKKQLQIEYSESYSDEFLDVELLRSDAAGECSFVVRPRLIKGRFLPHKVPSEIPVQRYRELSNRRVIEHDGREYDGGEYMEEDIDIGTMAVVYSTADYEGLLGQLREQNVTHFFCFHFEAAMYLSRNLEGRFYLLEDNVHVEYRSLYSIQKALNRIYPDFLLPLGCEGEKAAEGIEALRSCDTGTFNKEKRDFEITRAEQETHEPAERTAVPNTLLFLGTGCAKPSKYRNVSCILYESQEVAVMLDCGEDTLFQIHRAYGSFGVLEKLRMIFLSHSHADHVLGIVSVLRKMKHKVTLFAPAILKTFLEKFDLPSFSFVETDYAKELERRFHETLAMEHISDIGAYFMKYSVGCEVEICGVPHCIDSCGIRVLDGENIITYSGDTKPSTLFALMSNEAGVMIHEATFTNGQSDRAEKTFHSTVSDAVRMYRLSRAKVLLLTHFSQRYPKGVVSDHSYIPCMDLLRYRIGAEFPHGSVNRLYESLEHEEQKSKTGSG
jgi:ribonuclease Z